MFDVDELEAVPPSHTIHDELEGVSPSHTVQIVRMNSDGARSKESTGSSSHEVQFESPYDRCSHIGLTIPFFIP